MTGRGGGILPYFHRLVKLLFREHFQFEDVTVLAGVVGVVGQEEKVAVAVAKLKLWGRDVIVVEVEIGHEEALQVVGILCLCYYFLNLLFAVILCPCFV